jgi:hypothetical protein
MAAVSFLVLAILVCMAASEFRGLEPVARSAPRRRGGARRASVAQNPSPVPVFTPCAMCP